MASLFHRHYMTTDSVLFAYATATNNAWSSGQQLENADINFTSTASDKRVPLKTPPERMMNKHGGQASVKRWKSEAVNSCGIEMGANKRSENDRI